MRLGTFILGVFLSFSVIAQESPAQTEFVNGTHYMTLSSPVPTIVTDNEVEITEVFRFGCPACYRFEQELDNWNKAKHAALVQNPVVWDGTTTTHAKVYHMGKALRLEKETKLALFKAIHEVADTRAGQRALTKDADIIAMFVGLGADEAKVKKLMDNSTIKRRVQQSDERTRALAVSGTPELFVDGRYRISLEMAGSYAGMLNIANYLVDKVAAEKGLQ